MRRLRSLRANCCWIACLVLATTACAQSVPFGASTQIVEADGVLRSYRLYVPSQYDAAQSTPVVFVFHGAFEDGATIEALSGLTQKAEEEGFVVVYPNGTGYGSWLFWNAGGWRIVFDEDDPDDVGFVATVLDDLAAKVNVDAGRVFAAGFSLGGMLCYRLAAELPSRFAAIASVDGTVNLSDASAAVPTPVLHFHGTADPIIPYFGAINLIALVLRFESVHDTVALWCDINGCDSQPAITNLRDRFRDGTRIQQWVYPNGDDESEVVLIKIRGGGHTWPGTKPHFTLYGISTCEIQATKMIWDFFEKHSPE